MGSLNVKTKYQEDGAYGSEDEKTLYVSHSRSNDMVGVYDENGKMLFCYDDTMKNNVLDAIIRACMPYKDDAFENGLKEGVELMTPAEAKIILKF